MRHSSHAPPAELAADSVIAGRYRVEARLGQGGMGDVYRVVDERTGRRLALKRRAPAQNLQHPGLAFQFEREYHTLCELAHPRIIEVYDYGVSADGAYYTMELLDGQDLRERGRLAWREACAVLVDVASSLAIIHSRGLLHRDVSPRNVRCTADGRAKLIDFGAMMPFGPTKHLVGTPPFIPPEALQQQALDARADLFALGALAYLILTGRYAYPARSLAELRDVWTTTPAAVGRLQPDVPPALDQLVMGLLHVNRDARPATAAEVMERLAGIAGLAREDRIEVTRAYLVTPPLIGRRTQLEQVRAKLLEAMRASGTCIVVSGAPGTGRSRFLDGCVLEAKLLGSSVLRADATDANAGEYGIARALCEQLLHDLPELADASAGPRRSILAYVARALEHDAPKVAPEPELLQGALRDWFTTIARHKPLAIAIDDADAMDAASAAWLATLALRPDRRGLSLLFSARSTAIPTNALALIQTVAHQVSLERLTAPQTEALIRGMFGVEQVAAVAERIHQLAEGSPRETMALVEWMVERGAARYEAGSWLLPGELQAGDLPESLTVAWGARVASLPADARELGEALSLTDTSVLAAEDYPKLTAHAALGRTNRAIDALVAAGVLVAGGERHHRFRQVEFPELLSRSLDDARRATLHARIARVYESYDQPLRVVHHLLCAGEDREAIDRLLPLGFGSQLEVSAWTLSIAQRALEAAYRLKVSPRTEMQVKLWLLSCIVILGDYELFTRHAFELLHVFQRDSGLDDYTALDPSLPAQQRLVEALTRVQERYDRTPEGERRFTPIESIRYLALACSGFVNMASVAQSLELVEHLPSLEPLAALSPALGVAQLLVDGMRAFQSGHYEEARLTYLRVLERVQQPDQAGLEPIVHRSVRHGVLYFQGVISTLRGIPSAPDWLPELEQETGMRVNAWRVHMASELMQGNYTAAALCQRRSELAQVQDGPQLRYRGTTVRLELLAYARASDLLGVKRTIERIEPVARSHPRWEVDLCLARFHYKRLSADDVGALNALLPALDLVAPGRHVNWAITVATYVRALCAVGRQAEAVERGFEYLAAHEREGLSGTLCELTQSLSEALLLAGRFEEAAHYADRCIREAEELGSRGVFLGIRYETRARVALAMNDAATFDAMAVHCAREYNPANSSALSVLYARLMRDAEQPTLPPPSPGASEQTGREVTLAREIRAKLAACADSRACAAAALQLMIELSGARAGYLLGLCQGKLELLASEAGDHEVPRALMETLDWYLAWHIQAGLEGDSGKTLQKQDQHPWVDTDGRRFSPMLILGDQGTERAVAALAALHFGDGPRRAIDPELVDAIAKALLEQRDLDVVTVVL